MADLRLKLAGVAAGAALAIAGPALAQTLGASASSYNSGYGRSAGADNAVPTFSMRDQNGNLTIVNGDILSAKGQSATTSSSQTSSAYATFTGGVGASSATAIGNNLNVVVQGNYNTVVVTSTQTNTGAITATSGLTGGVSNGN